jgi:phosphatidylserine/phosphatidylglycerophosphate/cardiolipin synthase-like enzyme
MNFYFALSQGYEHKLYVRYLIYFVIALQIRLGNSTNNKTGRVEIFHPFIGWGTVCNNGWDDTDSGVVCRQLGFSGANATSKAYYEGGTGLILLDEVKCTGKESFIWDCSHLGFHIHQCRHSQDVVINCY